MAKKRHLYQSSHSFDTHPFEALYSGSWQPVEFIRIEDGIMLIYLSDGQNISGEKGPFANLRIRSRKANLLDCAFLRPGIDICVLSAPKRTENSNEENPEPVWVDAKISSIERKPHDYECACHFYINLYINQGPLGSEKGELSDDTETVGIDQIFILQKVERNPCENEYYRWGSSEDCSSLPRTKLFLGKFLSDLSWLLVTSVLKQISFEVKSVQNRIVYQILGANDESYSLNSANRSNAVNFRLEDGITVSTVVPFSPTGTLEAAPTCEEINDLEPYMYSCGMELRRSKRRNVQPERFLGTEGFPESDYKPAIYKTDKWNEDEMLLPLSYMFSMHKSSEERDARPHKIGSYECKIDSYEDFFDYKSKAKTKSKQVKSGETTQRENQNQNQNENQNQNQNQLAIVPLAACEPIAVDRLHLHSKFPLNLSQGNGSTSSRYYGINSSLSSQKRHSASKAQRKNIFDLDSMDFGSSRWERKASDRKNQRRSFQSMYSRRDSFLQSRSYNYRSLATGAYTELINSYMKNIGSKCKKEAPNVIDQWKEFHATSSSQQKKEEEVEPTLVEDEGEVSETEMLWKEMELSLASTYLEENEDSNAGVSTETPKKSSRSCQHDFKLEEEIGILCRLCGFVRTEIKYVAAPFMEHAGSVLENKLFNREVPGLQPDDVDDEDLEPSSGHASSDAPVLDDNDNVWALIPELRSKLHFHQRKAFEFLWRNVAGSLVPALMKPTSKKRGGCVISHSPGAGKTFLIIAFLVSYLKLFPGQRPLVLAPKTTLYTWYKEFIKWKIPIPVYLIHGRRTYRVVRQNSRAFPGPKPGTDVMHVLDCLDKIQKWHSQPSVLVMGYTSFLSLMREDSKFSHRRYMARVLRESPGMLILDEGHNPRSTKSRLRKVLMKVETELRILLSGTLFQNNFCEYFNTLCLARPKFIKEVLKVLDPKYKKKKFTGKARKFSEARARKFFIDNIARKIDSSEGGEERLRGLNMLRNITNGFIDVYEGGGSDTLPGLQIYTLLMNSTDVQHEVLVKLHKIMATFTGYPLELELLITLGSIHPWLIKTSHCVNKFFNAEELKELQKCKFDLRKGSKVKFVMNLVNRVVYKEKILIFCHNIAPIHLFLELFEQVYKWRKGREILVLTGDLELFERGRVMDQFEEPGGTSRILLASITACAEGISLTAASRVILLDSEWNPSKTKQAIARAFRPGQQKMVYVYQLLATGTLEEDKYRRTTWKEWVSSMIFSEDFVEDPSCWQAEKVGDDILRELVAEDRTKSFHMIMKNEKASTN